MASTFPHPDYRCGRTRSRPHCPIGADGQCPFQRQRLIAVDARVIGNRHHRAAIGELTFDDHRAAQQAALPLGGQGRIRAEDFVDGLVNTIANFVITLVSPVLRAAQTGLAQNYALMMVLGLLIAVALLFWRAFTGS